METTQEPVDEKKKRKRNKQVLRSIRQQVEFYFSDANLRKDRFLKQEIERSEDRYVEVAVIADFNRMKILCSDPALIPQALSSSDQLEMNDDKTRIRRKIPLGEPEYDPDDVTVYVECLPKAVDHDWLRRVFGVCGSVAYVSLPRYKSTGDPKGFAFIEFKTPEEANRACEMLHNPPDEDTGKLGRFPKTKGRRYVPVDGEDDRNYNEQRSNLDCEEDGRSSSKKRSHDDDDDDNDNNETHKRHKRRHRDSESSDVGKPDRHRRKRQHSDDGGDANSHGRKKRQDSNGGDVNDSKSKDEKTPESGDHHSRCRKDGDQDKTKKRRRDDSNDQKGDHADDSQSKKNRQSETAKNKDAQKAEEPNESKTKEKEEPADTKEEQEQLPDDCQKSSQSEKGKKKDEPNMEKSKEKCDDTEEEKDQDHSSTKSSTKGTEVENDDENNQKDEKPSRDDEGSSRKRKCSDTGTELDDNASKKTKREDEEEEKGKKKRTRKKKQEKKKEKEKETKDNDLQLRVISKKDWLGLKHKYLSLQKASLAKIKEAFRNNIYGDYKKAADESVDSKVVKSAEPEFTPGVVLKIEMKKAMESRQKLKDDLQTVAPVAYIDLQPGDQSGYVRCKTTEGATQILNKYGPNETETGSDISVTLVSGEDEQQYWEKLKADRSNKLSSKQKKKKKRGVDRLLCKAEKASLADMEKGSHIHFDDDE